MTSTQLYHELRALENELRLARNRLSLLHLLGEHELATATHQVITAQEHLKTTLTTRLHAFHAH